MYIEKQSQSGRSTEDYMREILKKRFEKLWNEGNLIVKDSKNDNKNKCNIFDLSDYDVWKNDVKDLMEKAYGKNSPYCSACDQIDASMGGQYLKMLQFMSLFTMVKSDFEKKRSKHINNDITELFNKLEAAAQKTEKQSILAAVEGMRNNIDNKAAFMRYFKEFSHLTQPHMDLFGEHLAKLCQML